MVSGRGGRSLRSSCDGPDQRGRRPPWRRRIDDAARLHDPDPELGDGVVTLRAWRLDDLVCVEEASRDPRIPRGTTVPVPFTVEAGREFIAHQQRRTAHWQGWSLAVTDPTGTAVGAASLLLRPQPGVAGLGYWILASARGRGYATAAARLLADWGLDTCGLARIEAWVEPDNGSSVRVLRRAGFEEEGRLRSFLTLGSRRTDVLVFSRLAAGPGG